MMPTKCRLLPQLRHDQHHHQDQASQRKQCAQDGNTHQIKKVFQKRQFRSDPVIERFGFIHASAAFQSCGLNAVLAAN